MCRPLPAHPAIFMAGTHPVPTAGPKGTCIFACLQKALIIDQIQV